MRELAAAIALSILAIAATLGMIGPAGAADMPPSGPGNGPGGAYACAPSEEVDLFTKQGKLIAFHIPTVPARTPYYTCITGQVLKPGDIPPPPEYCCG